jgi:AsmA protein
MAKILKTTCLILGLMMLILIIGVGVLITVVSPDKFKPIITAQVFKYTGRQLTIDGDLSWTLFPYLGVKVGHMVLNNAAGFPQKVFAEVTQATVAVKLLPLLHAKIEASGIALTGVKLNLVKNVNGETNWQDLQAKPAPTAGIALPNKAAARRDDQPVTTLPADSNKKFITTLEIPSLDIINAGITWDDQQLKQHVEIKQFELHASNISLDKAFPMKSTLNFAVTNPAASGQVSLAGQISLDLDKQTYFMKEVALVIKTDTDKKKLALDIKGDLTANLAQQTLKFDNFVGHMANLTLTGKVNIAELTTHPHATGHLQAQPFDLKQWLQAIGQDSTSVTVAKNVSADFDFATTNAKNATAGNPYAGLQAVNAQGKIKIEQLEAANLKINNIDMQTKLQDGVLALTPLSASLYQGRLVAQAKVNFTSATPQISLQSTLTGIQAEPLLKDLNSEGSKLKVKGVGNVDMQVTTAGLNADSVVRNLNGTGRFSLNNGVVDGIDVAYLADSAYALAQSQASKTQDTGSTTFGNLAGTVTMNNGVVTNNDLVLDAPRFESKGQGTIDLVNKQINYLLQTVSKEAALNKGKNIMNVYNLTIPVRIAGNFKNPSIKLDTGDILKQVAAQQAEHVRDQIKSKIKDQIKNQLPGKAGELLQNLLGQ